jgi:MYXO-CTERM domain-containing protein
MAQQSIKQARAFALIFALAVLTRAESADAFCGFYVTGADATLYANATEVVMMRDGTRTVLSIQNNYQGPPEAFALVVPVPVVLQQENVKVLPKDVFKHVDSLGAPRLVEYWETDPCQPQIDIKAARGGALPMATASDSGTGSVRVEAQFTVGEYDVVVLSASDSSGLDSWLRDNKYNIPSGAAPVLAPYVAAGMKFFVAKVDPARVTFEKNQAVLSPLRFHYDTQDFSLPVRLGLLNSQGSQDLIVNILAAQRYEVANYPNVTIPTNIRVQNDVRNDFASFYEALFSQVLEKNPKTVVTEYAWSSSSCDPCPTPPLTPQDLLTFGADVLQTQQDNTGVSRGSSFTLTRLHARYTKEMLGEDLIFQQASAIVGGRDVPARDGSLDQKVVSTPSGSTFQGRYVILHAWDKEIACQQPMRGFWGGPSGSPNTNPMIQASSNGALTGAAPRAGDLPALLAESLPALGVTARAPLDPLAPPAAGSGMPSTGGKSADAKAGQPAASGGKGGAVAGPAAGESTPVSSKKSSGCAIAGTGDDSGLALAGLALAWATFARRRRTFAGRNR